MERSARNNASGRSERATRSQSREVSDNEMSSRPRDSKRAKITEYVVSQGVVKGRPRRVNENIKGSEKLSTVAEDPQANLSIIRRNSAHVESASKTDFNIGPFSPLSLASRGAAARLKERSRKREMREAQIPLAAEDQIERRTTVQSSPRLHSTGQVSTPQQSATTVTISASAPPKIGPQSLPHRDNFAKRARTNVQAAFAPQETEVVDEAEEDGDIENGDDEDDGEDDYAFQTQSITNIIRRSGALEELHNAESNKENRNLNMERQDHHNIGRSLVDPQPNARSIEFDSQEPSPEYQQSQMDNPTQDAGFEYKKDRHTAYRMSSTLVSPDRRLVERQSAQAQSPRRIGRPQIADQGPRHPLATASDRSDQATPVPRTTQDYLDVNVQAKEMVAATKPQGRIQVRQPWSVEEITTLQDLVVEHGISYALLKRIDHAGSKVLQARDQVALKDKARNMKMDYLKSGTWLPRNFDKIPLSANLITKLENMSIQYDKVTGHRVDGEQDDDDEID